MNDSQGSVTIRTRSEGETRVWGRRLGEELKPGMMICLSGPLGAGKTVLASGILDGAGVPPPHRSPTFTLVWEHRSSFSINHVDLYRLSAEEAIDDLPWDYLVSEDAAAVVEWADRLPERVLPHDRMEILLVRPGEGMETREIRASAFGRCRRMLRGGVDMSC
ncbi:MAG: tRNA (adenosine(37)-N6)-threonylcarbamoyltransferase complex ATPase subunit type 1 TsaE [Bacillota bacterium]